MKIYPCEKCDPPCFHTLYYTDRKKPISYQIACYMQAGLTNHCLHMVQDSCSCDFDYILNCIIFHKSMIIKDMFSLALL